MTTQLSQHWKKNFLTIAIGQTVSLIGSSAVQFALIWWLSVESGSPMVLAMAGLFAFLPQIILGPFAGVWVDRMKRKTVIITADLFMGIIAVLFAIFFLFQKPPYWSAYVVLGIRAIGSVFHSPAIQAVVPMLVPKEELVRANGWNQFMQSGAFMLGPVLGAAMFAALPMPMILLTDFLGAVVACLTVGAIKIPNPEKTNHLQPNFFKEMKEGFKLFLNNKQLLILTLTTTACMIFFMPLSSFYPLMTSDYFKGSAWHAGLVESLYAVGMMLSAFYISTLGQIKRKFLTIYLGLIGIAVTTLISGILPQNMTAFWLFAALCGIMGASSNFFNIPYVSYIQETVPEETQGRAFSLIGTILSATMPLGLLISGPIAEKYGVDHWFLITGIAMLLIIGIGIVCMSVVSKRK